MYWEARKSSLFRFIAITLVAALLSAIPLQSGYAQVAVPLPAPGVRLQPTAAFNPAQMIGLKVDSQNPFHFRFVMDQGDRPLSDNAKKDEYRQLIKHFLASLTIANKDMWVNLSPYESNRIIGDHFSQTSTGQELLEQDYILKQFTASMMYPEEDVGRGFWRKVYDQVYQQFGTTDVPVDTFNKIWIRADRADIYQKDGAAFLVNSHLKVMLEKDYLAEKQNHESSGSEAFIGAQDASSKAQELSVSAVRDIIIPIIEKEVNEGSSFIRLRQIYNAMILATWFKKALKENLLSKVYADKNKLAGVQENDFLAKERIYEKYLAAFKVGVFNYIKDEEDPLTHEFFPRKYFSGGMIGVEGNVLADASQSAAARVIDRPGLDLVDTDLVAAIHEAYDVYKDAPDAETIRAAEKLSARVHFQDTDRKVDGVSYATQMSAVFNLIHFAGERRRIDEPARQNVLFYIPADAPLDSLFVRYAAQNQSSVTMIDDLEKLQGALTNETAIVFAPFARAEQFDPIVNSAGRINPQILFAFSAARIIAVIPEAKVKGAMVVSEQTLSNDLRAHRDRRNVAPYNPQEALQRLDALKAAHVKSAAVLPLVQKARVTDSAPVAGLLSGVDLDPVWNDLRKDAKAIAVKERVLEKYINATILDKPDLKSALSYLLAHKLASEHMDVDTIAAFVNEALYSSSDILDSVRADLQAVVQRDPASDKVSLPFLNYKGFHALAGYRIAHWLWLQGREDLALRLQSRISIAFDVDIHPAATVGKGVVIDHGLGVVIGATAVVGDGAYILHGVTLGSSDGKSIDGRRHPFVGKDVLLGAGAKIIGPVVIGDGVKVGANATVTKDVPAGATVVGINDIRLVEEEGAPTASLPPGSEAIILVSAGAGSSPVISASPVAASAAPSVIVPFPHDDDREVAFKNYLVALREAPLHMNTRVELAVAFLETQWLSTDDARRREYRGVSSPSGVSGMADVVKLLLLRNKDIDNPNIVLIRSAYGGTDANLDFYLKFGLDVRYVMDPDNELAGVLDDNTVGVIFESPNNPPLRVWDIDKIVKTVHSNANCNSNCDKI